MTLWAEWDVETGTVVQIRNDSKKPEPGENVGGLTGSARTIGGETTWHPIEVEYPETYVPRFPQLLGPSTMLLEDDGVVRQRFPDADYSEAAVRAALRAEVDRNAQAVLGQTDWYLTRKVELGTEPPAEVLSARAKIRGQVDALRDKIEQAKPSELLDMNTTLYADEGVVASPLPAEVGQRVERFPPRIEK